MLMLRACCSSSSPPSYKIRTSQLRQPLTRRSRKRGQCSKTRRMQVGLLRTCIGAGGGLLIVSLTDLQSFSSSSALGSCIQKKLQHTSSHAQLSRRGTDITMRCNCEALTA